MRVTLTAKVLKLSMFVDILCTVSQGQQAMQHEFVLFVVKVSLLLLSLSLCLDPVYMYLQ